MFLFKVKWSGEELAALAGESRTSAIVCFLGIALIMRILRSHPKAFALQIHCRISRTQRVQQITSKTPRLNILRLDYGAQLVLQIAWFICGILG